MVTGAPNAVSFLQHFANEEAKYRSHYQQESGVLIPAFRAQSRTRFTAGEPRPGNIGK
jgi:hypothetical protein